MVCLHDVARAALANQKLPLAQMLDPHLFTSQPFNQSPIKPGGRIVNDLLEGLPCLCRDNGVKTRKLSKNRVLSVQKASSRSWKV